MVLRMVRRDRLALATAVALLAAAWLCLRGPAAERPGGAASPALPSSNGHPAAPGELLDAGSDRSPEAAAEEATLQGPERRPEDVQPQDDRQDFGSRAPREELGTLRVEVVDHEGAPVPGVSISIHRDAFCTQSGSFAPDGSIEGSADGDGVEVFRDLAAGAWHVVATGRGKAISWRGKEPCGQTHVETQVKPDGESRLLVRLDPGLVIAGKVIYPDDARYRGMCVTALSEAGCGSREAEVAVDGSFRMEGLCKGPWRCHAGIRNVGRHHLGNTGTTDVPIANSAPVLVMESREDVELVLRRPASLSGRLVGLHDRERRGAPQLVGVAINRDTQHRYGLAFEDDVFFARGLDPGSYMIVAGTFFDWGVLDWILVEEESAVRELRIDAVPAARLSVSFRSDHGRVEVLLNEVRILDADVQQFTAIRFVPAGHLEVHASFDGSSQTEVIDAIGGQTFELSF